MPKLMIIVLSSVLSLPLLSTSLRAADMVEWPVKAGPSYVVHSSQKVAVYSQQECDDLLITYRKPPAADVVRVCYPPIF